MFLRIIFFGLWCGVGWISNLKENCLLRKENQEKRETCKTRGRTALLTGAKLTTRHHEDFENPKKFQNPFQKNLWLYTYPIGSMYGIFTYISHKNQPNVSEYTIHGSSEYISPKHLFQLSVSFRPKTLKRNDVFAVRWAGLPRCFPKCAASKPKEVTCFEKPWEKRNKSSKNIKLVSFLPWFCFVLSNGFWPLNNPLPLLEMCFIKMFLAKTHKIGGFETCFSFSKGYFFKFLPWVLGGVWVCCK